MTGTKKKAKKPQSKPYKTVTISITFDTDIEDIIESTYEIREMFSLSEYSDWNRRKFHININESDIYRSQESDIF